MQGYAMCLFKQGNLRVRGRGRGPSVLSFPVSHSTSLRLPFLHSLALREKAQREVHLVNPT